MSPNSEQEETEEETGRELRIKIALLATAVVLVAGYAAAVTDLGALLYARIGGLLSEGLAPQTWSAAAFAALAIALAVGLVIARRRRGKPARKLVGAADDALAAVKGREAFFQNLSGQLEAHAKAGRQLAIHLVDIDRFRAVNEALGEPEGDALLRRAAERLLVLVEHPERLARLGDDEFAVIQPETGGARHAEIYARRVQETLKDVCAQVPRHVRPGASIGVAVGPDHGTDPVALLHSASLALTAAKRAGGDCFRVFARGMEMAVEARVQMQKAIGNGLHEGWFELQFQPQYDLRARRLTGFEALVRMNHPELGELQSNEFLPAAEESGLIQQLGDWIIRDALATASHWPPHLTLAVNVSAAQFRHGDVAANILQTLQSYGIDGSRLQVEFTEAVLLHPSEVVQEQLRRLKERGVRIVIDDFGVGGSSLQALTASPCDAVKLDRSFVQRIGDMPKAEDMVRSLVGTARSFGLAVFAEGVERAEQAHCLVANGCYNVQGFCSAGPPPPAISPPSSPRMYATRRPASRRRALARRLRRRLPGAPNSPRSLSAACRGSSSRSGSARLPCPRRSGWRRARSRGR